MKNSKHSPFSGPKPKTTTSIGVRVPVQDVCPGINQSLNSSQLNTTNRPTDQLTNQRISHPINRCKKNNQPIAQSTHHHQLAHQSIIPETNQPKKILKKIIADRVRSVAVTMPDIPPLGPVSRAASFRALARALHTSATLAPSSIVTGGCDEKNHKQKNAAFNTTARYE